MTMRSMMNNRLFEKFFAREFFLSTLVISISIALIMLTSTYVTTIFLAEYPASMLSYYYFIQSIILMLATFFIKNIIASKPKSFCLVMQCISIMLIAAYLTIDNTWAYTTLFYCAALTTIVSINAIIAWNFVSWTYSMREFKENSRWFAAAGTLFGIALGYLLPFIIHNFGASILSYIIIITLAVFIIPILKMPITIHPNIHETKVKNSGALSQYKIFRWLFIYVVIILLSNTLIDFVVKGTIAETKSSNDIASYMAILYATTNIFVLGAQVFLMKPFLRWFGPGGILYATPIAVILSALAYLIYPSLITATMIFIVNLSIYYSLYNLAREISLNVLPQLVRAKAKSLVKGFAGTIGTIAGSLIILFIMKFFNLYTNVIIIMIASVLLIYLAHKIKFHYKSVLSDKLLLKRFKPNELMQQLESAKNYEEILSNTIKSQDLGLNLLAISILEKKHDSRLPKEVKTWLANNSDDLLFAVCKLCKTVQDKSIVKILDKRIQVEQKAIIKVALLQALYFQNEAKAIAYAKKIINDEDPMLKAYSAYILLQKGNFQEVTKAINIIGQLINSDNALERSEAAKVIGDIRFGDLSADLRTLLQDKSDDVCIHSLYAASKLNDKKVLPVVAKQINRNGVIYHMVKLANTFGDPLLKPLIEQLSHNKSLKNTVNAAKIINQIQTPKSEIFIIELLEQLDFFERYQIAKYFAYRCKAQKIEQKNIPNIIKIIKKLASYIISLHRAKHNAVSFLKKELTVRIFWAKKSLLYLLSSIANTEKILPILPSLAQAISQNNKHNINTALELIEAYLTTSEQKKILSEIFDDLDTAVCNQSLAETTEWDSWLTTMINYAPRREQGEIMESLEKVIVLRQCELFKDLPGETLLAIAEETEVLNFAKGDSIYNQGDIPDGLYIIAQGEVDLVRNKNKIIGYHQYDFFGFMGVLQNEPYYATAHAMSACQVLCLDKATFDRILEDIPDVLMSITHVLANYLAKIMVNERLVFPG